ncbi:PREDICTED: cilia- and flagella-associated protein 61-like [Nicrophorus vespilloides]|uniref:Cilia- and flagella-associated protein 61-like n=1 Tax=Nicrophorus vespilloides TaxID=110193 RepID=A0ABM1MS45_NICVS|nr:PREDICTED: cilia- and flagella-associated protein 61-like [Nicrophorus vespilloides]XP_017777396.1 PREDICTED: cilia- and flagella-associated protein 61-like [Nicrophorus vespilloides]
MEPLLRYLFEYFTRKRYVLFVIPSVCHKKVEWLNKISTKILPINYTNANRVQTLRLLVRQDFVINYKIRRAVEEDNDDLVPLIDSYSSLFRQIYGDFYIAEIITRHPDAGRQLIVAEYKGIAISVLCLNVNVNYEQLNCAFDLDLFGGLYKAEGTHVPINKQSVEITKDTDFAELSLERITTVVDLSSMPSSSSIIKTKASESYINIHDMSWNIPSSDSESSEVFEFSGGQSSKVGSIVEEDTESWDVSEEEEVHQADEESTKVREKQEENAFALEIAVAKPGHESSLFLLLEAAFECFPQKDYCILTIPSDHKYMQLLKFFTRVTPKNKCLHPHELYIVHKSISNPLHVKEATINDIETVSKFCSYIKKPGDMMETFLRYLEEPKSTGRTFLLYSGEKSASLVGVSIVNEIEDLNSLIAKYAIGVFTEIQRDKVENIGVIEFNVMSPLFRIHSKYFLRDTHRLSGYDTLFYAMNRFDGTHHRNRPIPSCLMDLYLVPAMNMTGGLSYPEEPFALYLSTTRLTSIRRYEINNRIVIVGSGYTGIAFMKGLLLTKNLQNQAIFNNVTLIAIQGLCHNKPLHNIRNIMQIKTSIIDYDYIEKLNLRAYVNIITGVVTGINRQEKTVMINKSFSIPYDMLFLMCGNQYIVPNFHQRRSSMINAPENLFTINSESDATNALTKLYELSQNYRGKYTVMVYGHNLECYCCVAALIEFGVPPMYITLVEPAKDKGKEHDFIFQDDEIYEKVMKTIGELGINYLPNYKMIEWGLAQDDKQIMVMLESQLRYLEIECLAVFLYNDKSINMQTYEAIVQSGLVFDGKLVIGPHCNTNDPYIYAAGSVTKYSRRYYANHLLHRYFNSEEIGLTLGKKIRSELIPFNEDTSSIQFTEQCWNKGTNLVPIFEQPLMQYCQLPGNMYYLHIYKPGIVVPLEAAMCDNDYGTVLVTGMCKNLATQGYFRIQLNPSNVIHTITCLSLQSFSYKKLLLLWGKHEAVLNKLVKRFELSYVPDLFEYFDKPWASALFHDDFPYLEEDIMRMLSSKSIMPGASPIEDLVRLFNENGYKPLSTQEMDVLLDKFKDSPYEELIVEKLLDFLGNNLKSLPMYAHPILISYLLAGYEESSLFKDI